MEEIKNVNETTVKELDDKIVLSVPVEVSRKEVVLKEYEVSDQDKAINVGKQLLELSQQVPDLEPKEIDKKFNELTSDLRLKYEETIDVSTETIVDVDCNIHVDGEELVNLLEEIDTDTDDENEDVQDT